MTSGTRRQPAGAAVLREDITSAIQDALLEELAAAGDGRLSIEAVARRAGVGKTAVYRRWGSKLDLVIEVVSRIAQTRLRPPDTGSLAGDLILVTEFVARALRHPLASHIIPDLLAEAARNPGISKTMQDVLRINREEVGRLVVERAISRGEVPPGVDAGPAIEMLLGSVYWKVVIAKENPSHDYHRWLAGVVAVTLTERSTISQS